MEKPVQRSSSFELLRIVSMFMVVLGHCILSTAEDQEPILGVIDMSGWFIKSFTICAVDCFFLLTGYFVRSDRFRFSKILSIWFKTFFYSVLIYLIVSLVQGDFDPKMLFTYMLPVTMKKYWYMQVYVALAFLAPFLALMLERLDKKQHTYLLVILFVFFSFHETFVKAMYTLDESQGYGIIWACVLLVVGKWLKRWGVLIQRVPKPVWMAGYISCSMVNFFSNYLIIKFDIADGVTSRGNFYANSSVTVLAQSLCLFCFFIKLSEKMEYSKSIDFLASNILAVYLISSHPLVLYPLWVDLFRMEQFWDKPVIYIFLAVVLTILVVLVCILIDKIVEAVQKRCGLYTLFRKADKFHFGFR